MTYTYTIVLSLGSFLAVLCAVSMLVSDKYEWANQVAGVSLVLLFLLAITSAIIDPSSSMLRKLGGSGGISSEHQPTSGVQTERKEKGSGRSSFNASRFIFSTQPITAP